MCGIVGTISIDQTSEAIRMMLHALQNRGQQAAGIVTLDGTKKHEYRAPGTVIDFPLEELNSLVGTIGIGHNRYATAANSSGPKNMQPFLMTVDDEPIAIAHNGNFTNTTSLREKELKGVPFVSESDTEVFFRLLLRAWRTGSFEDSVIKSLAQDVEAQFPELVSVNSDGYKQVDFRALPFYILEALKELWEKVQGQDERLEELEEENQKLKERIIEIENELDIDSPQPTPDLEPATEEPPVTEPVQNSEPTSEPVEPII